MADPLVIEATALRKQYGAIDALSGLDLHVPRGSIYGFLGKNGAGKTTTLKILMGMTRPSGGRVRVFDLPADDRDASVAIRRRTGFVSEEKDLYGHMSVDEVVAFTAAFYPRWQRDLEQRYRRAFGLPAAAKVKALSHGTRAKLALLLALCRGAELLVLDEPTSGLDPAVTEEVLQAIVGQVASGDVTVLFSSHDIAEVEQIADQVAIVDRGRTVVAGALDALRERYCRVQMVFAGEAPAFPSRAAGVQGVRREGRVLTVLASNGSAGVLDEARALGPVSVDVVPVTLKEIFLASVAEEN